MWHYKVTGGTCLKRTSVIWRSVVSIRTCLARKWWGLAFRGNNCSKSNFLSDILCAAQESPSVLRGKIHSKSYKSAISYKNRSHQAHVSSHCGPSSGRCFRVYQVPLAGVLAEADTTKKAQEPGVPLCRPPQPTRRAICSSSHTGKVKISRGVLTFARKILPQDLGFYSKAKEV